MKHGHLVLLGVGVHLVLLYAIFEVFYQSPVVRGLTGFPILGRPPAKRLVLFVADGLRAQSFFSLDDSLPLAPFLHMIMQTKGSWGVSHTRVPTESRPGHVALIAGFYEDVSAVMRGWKENPVEFDSVFNQSVHTWAWGSPDILPIFTKNAANGQMETFMYSAQEEDFASADASQLDTWVFDRVLRHFAEATSNKTLDALLRQDGVVLFLHLLGLDTNGHGYKPHSKEYRENIGVVDEGVARVTETVESFHGNDGRTSYIFTSDHGMTDWGSHGAGEDEETMTPLVAWGAGIRRPFHGTWERKDLHQADVAPLMSVLLGRPIPVNSVGVLPTAYLNTSAWYTYQAALANFRQVAAQFLLKREQKFARSLRPFFRECPVLSMKRLAVIKAEIQKLADQKRFRSASEVCLEWIPRILDCFLFYHRYEQSFLSGVIALIFISWLALIWTVAEMPVRSVPISLVPSWKSCVIIGFLAFSLLLQALPWTVYIYCFLPIYLTDHLLRIRQVQFLQTFPALRSKSVKRLAACFFLFLGGVSVLVLTFSHRSVLFVAMILVSVWPFLPGQHQTSAFRRSAWVLVCVSSAIFPLLPPVGLSSNYWLVLSGPALALLTALCRKSASLLVCVAMLCCCVSVFVTEMATATRAGTPFPVRLWSWAVLAGALWLPMLGTRQVWSRLESVAWALGLPYTLFSLSHETLFYFTLVCLLWLWLELEWEESGRPGALSGLHFAPWPSEEGSTGLGHPLTLEEWRQAFFFVLFLFLAFFGTGNVASLNSFNPSFLRCFTTVFRPFLMAALLLLKICIPFVLVGVALCALEQITCHSVSRLLLPILVISDAMALVFFFQLKDSGSWLEIGMSISHYVLAIAVPLVILFLHKISQILAGFKLIEYLYEKRHLL